MMHFFLNILISAWNTVGTLGNGSIYRSHSGIIRSLIPVTSTSSAVRAYSIIPPGPSVMRVYYDYSLFYTQWGACLTVSCLCEKRILRQDPIITVYNCLTMFQQATDTFSDVSSLLGLVHHYLASRVSAELVTDFCVR